MSPNPVKLCSYKKGKFGYKDRHVQTVDDVKTQGEDHLQFKEYPRLPEARKEA